MDWKGFGISQDWHELKQLFAFVNAKVQAQLFNGFRLFESSGKLAERGVVEIEAANNDF